MTFSPCSAPSKKRFASLSLSPLLGVFVVESETVVVWSHCRQLCTYSLLHRYHFSDNSTNTESIASRQTERQRQSKLKSSLGNAKSLGFVAFRQRRRGREKEWETLELSKLYCREWADVVNGKVVVANK